MRLVWVVIPLILFGIIGIQESYADEFGEYFSLGNTWIELPFSLGNTPPWQKYWETNHPGEYFPRDWDNISTEKVIAENFYKNFDIQIMDVIFSDKNAEYCLGYGCSLGTYHLLISNDDVDKFHNSFVMQKSLTDNNQQMSNATKNGTILTLEMNKSEYLPDELIHFAITVENSNSFPITFLGIGACSSYYTSNMHFSITGDGTSISLLHENALLIPEEDPVTEFLGVKDYGILLENIKNGNSGLRWIAFWGLTHDVEYTINLLNEKYNVTDIENKPSTMISFQVTPEKLVSILRENLASNSNLTEPPVCTLEEPQLILEPFEKIRKEFVRSQLIDHGSSFSKLSPGTYTLETKLMEASQEGVDNPITTQLEFQIKDFAKPSLRIQLENGISPEQIECNERLELIFKSSDNSPACVKPETAEKLIQRGWAKSQ